jgi:hypothetical protein
VPSGRGKESAKRRDVCPFERRFWVLSRST